MSPEREIELTAQELAELREDLRNARATDHKLFEEIERIRTGWTLRAVIGVAIVVICGFALAAVIGSYAVDIAKDEGRVTRELLASKLDALKEAFERYVDAQDSRDDSQEAALSETRKRQDDVRDRLRAAEMSIGALNEHTETTRNAGQHTGDKQ
jgi:hypothetical protein